MRSKKSQRIISPVIRALRLVAKAVDGGEFVQGHEFHRGDAQRLQVRDLFDHAAISAGMLDSAGTRAGKTAHVHFVYDGLVQGSPQVAIALPVEFIVDEDRKSTRLNSSH